MKAFFISLEGGEGAGKSTHKDFIAEYLKSKNISFIQCREPGGTQIGEEIRETLIKKRDEEVTPETELLLMFACRAQLYYKVIQPSLEKNISVICDRFIDASYAYQGGGRQIGMESVDLLDELVLQKRRPDLTFIFDLAPEKGLSRVKKRGGSDRFELESVDFFSRVREVYLEIARKESQRCIVIDANQSIENVQQEVMKYLDGFIDKRDDR